MNRRLSLVAATLAVLMCALQQRTIAATPADFGFGSIKVNGKSVTGQIPLLLITFELSTNGNNLLPLRSDANAVFDSLVFDAQTFPSVDGYYLENSAGTGFSWRRAAVLGPVPLDPNETATLNAQQSDNKSGLDSPAGIAYLLSIVAAKTGYNFAQWDGNRDGNITQDELSIMVVGNAGSTGGANRSIGAGGSGLAIPGQNVTLHGRVASFDHHVALVTLAHELSHSLGTVDLYLDSNCSNANCWNSGVTLMSCTLNPTLDDRRTYHLDPWHKIQLGWVTPQIFELGPGGVATVSVPQRFSFNAPVILYDPARGTSEYFIIEFRNNQVANKLNYDLNVTDPDGRVPFNGIATGMAIWHVSGSSLLPGQTRLCTPVFHEGAPGLTPGGSALWNGQTPLLQWNDGTVTGTHLHTLGVSNDGYDLTFEWLTAADTWVDFAYAGSPSLPELGTFDAPFNTMAEAVVAASRGGTLQIKTGSTAEIISVNKPLSLQAVGGPVSIGK